MGRHLVAAPPVRPGRRADPVAADVRVVRQRSGDQRCSRQSETAWRPVFPAVSYWAVFDQGVAIDETVRKMSGQLVKLIQANCSRGGGDDITAMTLFIAVKDHCSSYVHQKIRRSRLAQSTADLRPSNAKLVAVPRCKYIGQLRPSMTLMRNVGMHMDLHELDEH